MNIVRRGCSGLITFLFLCVGLFMAFGWGAYVDRMGAPARGVVTEKSENIRIWYSEWYRRFELIAAYSIPGQPMARHAVCDVDEKTFDSFRVGDAVAVHYFPALLVQPFVPAAHLQPCSALAGISFSSSASRHLAVVFLPLLVILLLWRLLRIRFAAWLLLPWLCFAAPYLILPHVEPEPARPVAASAQVDSVDEINSIDISERRRHEEIPLLHPYEMVRLRFLPSGRDTPVTAVDKVDKGSVPNLGKGQIVAIVYSAANPRVVRLQQGTREFARQAGTEMLLLAAVFCVLSMIALAIGSFFRRVSDNLLSRR